MGRSSFRRHSSKRPRLARRYVKTTLTTTLTSDSAAAVKAATAARFTQDSLALPRPPRALPVKADAARLSACPIRRT
jgi:hypothetical protein